MLVTIIFWIALCILIGWWAKQWGRDPAIWGIISFFLSPIIAGIALAVLGEDFDADVDAGSLKKCPFCAELIKPEAIKCKHCGSDIAAIKNAEYLNESELTKLIDDIRNKGRGA